MSQSSNHTTLIICEGENTEPLFFKSILDFMNEQLDTSVTLRPEPREEDEISEPEPIKHKPVRKKRKTHKVEKIDKKEDAKKTEGYPLNWVLEGKAELNDGTYDEVWVVFDHDNHPKRKEAFEAADIAVDGKKVQIAFSSRSFEYYFLVHFEKIYHKFEKTDCKFDANKGKVPKKRSKDQRDIKFVRCATNLFPTLDCHGEKCINGYAHSKGYWNNTENENSKSKNNFFQEIKGKLENGYENAAWIRFMSEKHQGTIPDYERNPYLTTDNIVKRLMLNTEVHKWIDASKTNCINGLRIRISADDIHIKNEIGKAIIFKEKSITGVCGQKREVFGEREVIHPNKEVIFNIPEHLKSDIEWFKIKYGECNIMIDCRA